MNKRISCLEKIEVFPLTPERWDDFEVLFGKNGAGWGCWCMWWRLPNKEFVELGKEGRKNAIRTLVHQGVEAGLIAYADGVPAGWVTVAPRSEYLRLKTSRILAPLDDLPVWTIPCFFVPSKYRRLGLMSHLIHAAVEYARSHGAAIIEAYPREPDKDVNPLNIYTGVSSVFISAGFVEVARRKPNRPVMRKFLS